MTRAKSLKYHTSETGGHVHREHTSKKNRRQNVWDKTKVIREDRKKRWEKRDLGRQMKKYIHA